MFNSTIDLEEDSNSFSQDSVIDSSNAIPPYFDTFLQLQNNVHRSSNENNNQNNIKENEQDLSKIINEVEDLVKCYICLGQIKEPKMCRFCHRLACGNCLRQWLRGKKTCGYCRKILTIVNIIDIPFMKNIPQLINYNKNLEEKKDNLEEQNKILNKKLNDKLCNKHKEKILYFCFNCNKNLCGICTSFTNKESKIHIGHKIFEYSKVEKSKYNEIINQIDMAKDQQKELDNKKKECEDIKIFNEFKYRKEKQLLDMVYKEIESRHKEQNSKILEKESITNKINKKIEEKCKDIEKDLVKIESLDKMIDNMNIDEIKTEFKNLKNAENKIKEKDDKNIIDNSLFEFKSFIYNFENQKIYESLKKEKDLKIKIETPIPITFIIEVIREDLLLINFPVSIIMKEKNNNNFTKKINLYTFLQINNTKFVEFKKIQKSSLFYGFYEDNENKINNSILPNLESSYIENKFDDAEDDKELKNLVNNIKSERKNAIVEHCEKENVMYRAFIKLSDFKNGNKLSLVIYYYSFYN